MDKKKIPNPYEVLYKIKELLENNFKYQVTVGFVERNLLEKSFINQIVISPMGDYLESQGLAHASRVDNPEFSYNVHFLIKSKVGEEPLKKFLEERQQILETIFSEELINLDTKIMSQSVRTTINNEIAENITYDIWIATFEVTAKIRK